MNNEDLSEIIEKLKSTINNSNNQNDNSAASDNSSISPEAISNMIQMLKSKTNNNNSQSENTDSNIDIETIMKLKAIFDKMNSNDDPRSKLLLALKPYLKDSRKEKLDKYVQLFNISKVIDVFGFSFGGDIKK